MSRKYTNKLLELMEEGLMNPKDVAETAIGFMSEDDVEALCRANDWVGIMGLDDEDDQGECGDIDKDEE
jgi:hypothetical protein